MAIKNIRVSTNSAGAQALLRDSGVQAGLLARGGRIATAAGNGFEVRAASGRDRGVVFVTTATDGARLAEAEDRALTRAIGAGS